MVNDDRPQTSLAQRKALKDALSSTSRHDIERVIRGALKGKIATHGPITLPMLQATASRIAMALYHWGDDPVRLPLAALNSLPNVGVSPQHDEYPRDGS